MKTHYRKAFNSLYLSSADIVEPITLTVREARLEPDHSKKTKDSFNTLYFQETEIRPGEKLKPMVLNATNSKTMKELTNSYYLEDWHDLKIQVYVEQGIKFGRDIVDGLRIKAAPKRHELKPGMPQWGAAVSAYKRDGNFEQIEKRVILSDESKALVERQSQDGEDGLP